MRFLRFLVVPVLLADADWPRREDLERNHRTRPDAAMDDGGIHGDGGVVGGGGGAV